jgi:hypothetical protein
MSVIFMTNYFLVEDIIFINSETLLMIDFIHLKIKSIQSFRGAHRNRIYVHVFTGVSTHICMSMYVYMVFLRKNTLSSPRPNFFLERTKKIVALQCLCTIESGRTQCVRARN